MIVSPQTPLVAAVSMLLRFEVYVAQATGREGWRGKTLVWLLPFWVGAEAPASQFCGVPRCYCDLLTRGVRRICGCSTALVDMWAGGVYLLGSSRLWQRALAGLPCREYGATGASILVWWCRGGQTGCGVGRWRRDAFGVSLLFLTVTAGRQ